jgi:hypothetical protein
MSPRPERFRFPADVAKSFVMVVALTAGVASVSACTSGGVGAGPKATTTPSAGASLPCAAVTETEGRDTSTLSWQDVWPNAGGGGNALSVKDLRRCATPAQNRPALTPRCSLGFPWRSADKADVDLAAVGVVVVQLKHLVKSSDAFVDETILSFDAPKSAGAAQLVKESIGCGQGDSPSQGGDVDRTRWLGTSSGSRLALVESGSRLIVVEFADPSLKQAPLQMVVRKAVNLSVKLG